MYLLEYEHGRKVLEGERIGFILSESHEHRTRKAGDRMIECAKHARVYVWTGKDGCEEFEIRSWRCFKRGCLTCDRVKCNAHIRKLFHIFDDYGLENVKFITCTFPRRVPVGELRDSLDAVSESLRKLFRMKSMSFVRGGFKAYEAVCKPNDNSFNPHCHMLVHHEGKDLREDKNIQRFLKSEVFGETFDGYLKYVGGLNVSGVEKTREKIGWFLERGFLHQLIWSALFKSVGLGAVCHVNRVNRKSALEVAKYFTKTWEVPDDCIEPVFNAMRGKRLFSSFGSFKVDVDFEVDEESRELRKRARFYGTLKEVVENAVALERGLDMRVLSDAKSKGLVNLKILDVPMLDSGGWRGLGKEERSLILGSG